MDIDIEKALDFIRDHASEYAQAKAHRIHIEEFRKSKKAILMQEGAKTGLQSVAAQEVYAYAHQEYLSLLDGLKSAVEREEYLRWLIEAARLKIEVWRSLESSRRSERII